MSRLFTALLLIFGLAPNLAAQLSITTGDATVPVGRVEIPLEAANGTPPYAWSLVACAEPGLAVRTDLPGGFPPGTTAGLIGVATSLGPHSCTVRVTDGALASAEKTLVITVFALRIQANWELPVGAVGMAYDYTISTAGASGGLNFAVTNGALPAGLNLDASTGRISGSPTQEGPFDFDISVADSVGSAGAHFRIVVTTLHFITSTQLPNATQGAPYSTQIQVSGGTEPYTFSVECCIPGEFSMNPATGAITGTPQGPGNWSFPVRVTDNAGSSILKNFTLGSVGNPLTLPGISMNRLDDIPAGEYLMASPGVFGGTPPYTLALNWEGDDGGLALLPESQLPPSWAPGTAVIHGTPITPGVYTFTLTAQDSSTPAQSVTRRYTFRVAPLSNDWPAGGTHGSAYSQQLRVLGGPPPYSVSVVDGKLPFGLTLSSSGLLEGTPQESGNFSFQVQMSGAAGTLTRWMGMPIGTTSPQFIDFNVGPAEWWDVPVNSSYSMWLNTWGGTGAMTWSLESGTLPHGITLDAGGMLSGTPDTVGKYSFFLRATDASGNFGVRRYTIQVTPISQASNWDLPWGSEGSSYTTTLAVSGGRAPITWTLAPGEALPPGMSLSAEGVLSGTPEFSGYFSFRAVAADADGYTLMRYYAVPLYAPGTYPPLVITAGDQLFSVGRVEMPLSATGGNGSYTWAVTGLPPGLALRTDVPQGWQETAGLIGIATAPRAEPYSVTVQATSGGETVTKTVQIRITGLVVTSNWQLPDGAKGAAYDQRLRATGGAGQLIFALQPGQSLPSGLSLATDGRITGVPTAAGGYGFGFTVTDGDVTIGSGANIYVSELNITAPIELPTATQSVPYSRTIIVTGGTGPYTFSWQCCTPGWLTQSSGGVLSGTPDGPGYHQLQVTVTDTAGNTAYRNFALGVIGTPLTLLSISPLTLEDATVGENRGYSIWVNGGTPPYTWSATGLPEGMNLLAASEAPRGWATNAVTLMGTPATAGTHTFTLSVTDSSATPKTTSWQYTLRVSPLSVDGVPNPTFQTVYSGTFRVLGGQPGYTFTPLAGDYLPDGLTLSAAGLLSGTALETGGRGPTYRITGEAGTLERSLGLYVETVPWSGLDMNMWSDLGDTPVNSGYGRGLWAGGGSGNNTWTLEPGSTLPAGVSLSGDSIVGTPTQAGRYTFKLRATDTTNSNNFAVRMFRLQVTPINITTNTSLPYANAGAEISRQLEATGASGTLTWILAPGSALPTGLTLSSNGLLSGTTNFTGHLNFTVIATDSATGNYSSTRNFDIPIYPAGEAPPMFITTGDQLVSVGRVEMPLSATGGNGSYSWAVTGGTLPPGLALRTDVPQGWQETAGLIGVATAPRTEPYSLTVQVTSGGQTITKTIQIRVTGLIVTNRPNLADGAKGVAYDQRLRAAGVPGQLTFALQQGHSLPPGLTLATDGRITGVPTTAGDYGFNFTVSDGDVTIGGNANIYISELKITTPIDLPVATQGAPYSRTIIVEGGTPPYTFSWQCCRPGWLAQSSTGVLSGTPDGPGHHQLQVTVTDNAGHVAYRTFALGVIGTPATLLSISPMTLEDVTVGENNGYSFWVNGGTPPYTWSAAGLPEGMSLLATHELPRWWSPAGATLTGAPTTVGPHTFTMTATDSSPTPKTTSWQYTLNASALSVDWVPTLPYNTESSRTLRVVGGAPGYTFERVQGELPYGTSLSSAGVLSGTPRETWGFGPTIRITGAAGTLTRSVGLFVDSDPSLNMWIHHDTHLPDVLLGSGYGWQFGADGGSGSYTWTLEPDTALPPGMTLTSNNLAGTPNAAGHYLFLVRATDAANPSRFAVKAFRLQVTPINITTNTSLPYANAGTEISRQLEATGNSGTLAWTLAPGSALPLGLTLSSSGLLSGTTNFTGHLNFTVVATDSATGNYSCTRTFDLPIYPSGALPPLAITTPSNWGTFPIGPFEYGLSATGGSGSYSWEVIGTLPPGLSLRNDKPSYFGTEVSGTISGLATTANATPYSFTIKVTSGGESISIPVSVKFTKLIIKDSGIPDGFVGAEYTHTFTALDKAPSSTLMWATDPNQPLPGGLSLSPSGVLSGIPDVEGTYHINVNVTDGTDTVGRGFRLFISSIRITTPGWLPNATQDSPYDVMLTSTGGTGTLTWTVNGGLPWGLVLDTNGRLHGSPANAGTWHPNFVVTDGEARFYSKPFALNVVGVPPILPQIQTGSDQDDLSLGNNTGRNFWASGGTGPYTWQITGAPDGMSLRPAITDDVSPGQASLEGTPTRLGAYETTVSVTDATSVTVSRKYTLRVVPIVFDWSHNPPPGNRDVPYTANLRTLGGRLSYTWAVAENDELPAGLSLNAATGIVSGTPLENQSRGVRFVVTDADGLTYVQNQHFSIGDPTSTVHINTGRDLGPARTGQSYSFTLWAFGAPSYTWSAVDPLPAGLTLDSATGVLSGTPATTGIYRFLVRAADSANPANNGTLQLKLNVTPLYVSSSTGLPYGNQGSPYSQTITVSGNAGPVTFKLAPDSSLPEGLTLNQTTGVISGTPLSLGNWYFNVVITDAAGGTSRTVGFNVNLYPPGTNPPLSLPLGSTQGPFTAAPFSIGLQASGGYPPYTYSIKSGANSIPGVRVQNGPPLPNNMSWATGAIFGFITTPGSYSTVIQVTDSRTPTPQTLDVPVTIVISPLFSTNQWNPPNATVGTYYTYALNAIEGTPPYAWTLVDWSGPVPPGMELTTDGVLRGTPTSAGTYEFFPTVRDAASNTITLYQRIVIQPFAITTAGVLPAATAGTAYNTSLIASAPNVTWNIAGGSLPQGLSLNSTTGVISGTPTGSWYGTVTVRAVSGSGGQARKIFTLFVAPQSPASLTISMSSALPDNPQGYGYTHQLWPNGGTPPYTWEVIGTLPEGLRLAADGDTLYADGSPGFTYLIGTTAAAGSYSFGLRLRDRDGREATQNFTLRVATVHIEYLNLPVGGTPLVYNTPYTQPMLAWGGTGTFTWTASGMMPPGLALSSAGTVSGTPGNTGTFDVLTQIVDGEGATTARNVRYNIASGTAAMLWLSSGPDLGAIGQGNSSSWNVTAWGSPLPTPDYTYTVLGSLPTGCALLSGATMPGGMTPGSAKVSCVPLMSPGSYSFTIKAQDSAGNLGVKTYYFKVSANTIFNSGGAFANASAGVPYTQTLLAFGGPANWAVAAGSSLPAGLTLSSDGVLSGTPTAPGEYSFSLGASDGSVTLTRNFNIHVSSIAITNPAILPSVAITNVPFSYALTATGGGASKMWSVLLGSLPSGITLSPDGVISGTTASPWRGAFVVRVTDGSDFVEKRLALFVRDKYASILTFGAPTNKLADAFLHQNYSANIVPSGGVPPYTCAPAAGSSLPPGMSLISGAALPHYTAPHATLLAGTPSAAADHTFTLECSDSDGQTIRRDLTLHVAPLALTTDSLPNAMYGASYAAQLTAVGGTAPYAFSLPAGSTMPPGLTLSGTGAIGGTPANTGSFSFRVLVTSGGASFERSINLYINSATAQTVEIGNAPLLPDMPLGTWRATRLNISGGTAPYTVSVLSGTLPAGISVVRGTDIAPEYGNDWYITGRPTAAGPYTFTVAANDSSGNTGYKTFKINISQMQVLAAPWPGATAGQTFSQALRVVGGTPNHSFALTPETVLPPGVTLSAAGVLSGSTTLTGTFSYTFVVSDGDGATLTQSRSFNVWPSGRPIPISLYSDDNQTFGGTLYYASSNANYLDRVHAWLRSPGTPPFTWDVASGSLPAGMKLVSPSADTAYLTGPPPSPGDYSFGLSVTDGEGQTVTGTFRLNVSNLSLSPEALPGATLGAPYSVALTPAGGTPPYTFELRFNSTMPVGVSLIGGVLSGTPESAGRYYMTITVRDSAGASLMRSYYLYVDAPETPLPSLVASPSALNQTWMQGSPLPSIGIATGSTGASFTAVSGGIPNATATPASGTTPGSVSINLGSTNVGQHYGIVEFRSPGNPDGPLGVRAAINVVPLPPCTYSVTPDTAAIASAGGTGTLTITTRSDCAWTATPSQSWIVLTSSAAGTGNGSVTYAIGGNPDTGERTGTVSVEGVTHSITQFGSTCAYTIEPSSLSATASGGSAVVSVTASLASCNWTVSGNGWIGISPASGTGSGTVTVTIAPNAGPARNASVTVAGRPLAVSQGGASCVYSLSSPSAEMTAAGGDGSVTVSTQSFCPYTTMQGPSWITVTSGGSGTGGGTVSYSVAANSSTSPRSGSLVIGGQVHSITQMGVECSFSVTNNNPLMGSGGGPGSITIAATHPNCGWTASSNADWLTLTSGSGTGSATVQFNAGPNGGTSVARSGTLTVAGQTVTVNQNGVNCSYTLRSANGTAPATGGAASVGVVAATGCSWTAASNAAWLTISSGTGSGTGDVLFGVLPNTGPDQRSGTLTIEGQTHTVTQGGVPCSYVLSAASVEVASGPSSGTFSYIGSSPACSPAPVSFSDWISVSGGGGSGTVSYTVPANPTTGPRTGTIRLGDQTFTIRQIAGSCPFSLNAYGAAYSNLGGGGYVLASAAGGCGAPVVGGSPELLPLPLPSGPVLNVYTQNYTVPPFQSLVTWIRLLYLNVSGQNFTIKQSSW